MFQQKSSYTYEESSGLRTGRIVRAGQCTASGPAYVDVRPGDKHFSETGGEHGKGFDPG